MGTPRDAADGATVVEGHRSAGTRPAVMHDVARLAGVSHQTVSRVINDHPSVRPETRERVQRAMRELDYRPNPLARGLVTRRSGMIGAISFDTRLHGPAATLAGLESAARAAGYGVIVIGVELQPEQLVEAARRLTAQAVDGIAVIAPSDPTARAVASLASSVSTTVPVVALEAGYADEVTLVSVDQEAGARAVTRHLLDLGHRSVCHVAGPGHWLEAQDRMTGWRETLAEAGIDPPPVIPGDWSAAAGYAAADQVVAAGATAVFAANDQTALGLLRGLYEKGVRVPRDVSVVGFDDIPEAAYLIPGLTTVRQPFDEVGRSGLQALMSALRGEPVASPPRIEPVLVVRDSTGPPPARPTPPSPRTAKSPTTLTTPKSPKTPKTRKR